MPGLVPSLSHLPSILLVPLLVLSTPVLWAQRTSTLEESAVQLPDAPSRIAPVSEAQTHPHLTYKGLAISFMNRGQIESWIRLFPDHTDYNRHTNAVLNQDSGTAEFQGENNHLIGGSPTMWMTFVATSATYIMRRSMEPMTWRTMGATSHGPAPLSCELVGRLKLTPTSQLC